MKLLLSIAMVVLLSFSSVVFAVDHEPASETLAARLAVNINVADIDTLTQLQGVGEKKAAEIVAWREANGAFTSADQLLEVKGIGRVILEANKDRIQL